MKRTSLLVAAAMSAVALPAHAANPDVSVVGDIRYNSDFKTQREDLDQLKINEVELAIQGYLSPWSKADIFLSHSADSALEVEEGFLTLMSLPNDLQARIGKFKVPFGKLNPIHPEGWTFIDTPLVIRNLLGEEGWNNTGVELTGFIPNPFDQLITATVDVLDGGNEVAFGRGPMANLRLFTYFPFSDEAGLEVGLGGASQFREPVDGSGRSSLAGMDLRYRWRPDPTTSFTLLGEYMQLFRNEEAPSGAYLSADYQWQTAHDVDLRLDRSYAPGGTEPTVATSLTYGYTVWETTRFKLQGTHTWAPAPDDRVLFQTVFVLGPHKHALNF